MQYTRRATRKFVQALAHDAESMRPYVLSTLTGVLTGLVIAACTCAAVFIPHAVESAVMAADARSATRIEEMTDDAYARGALDLIEGRVTLREEVERAFILLETPSGDISRVPLDNDGRRRIHEGGWEFRQDPDMQTMSGG